MSAIFACSPHPTKKANKTKERSQSISTWEVKKSLSTLGKKWKDGPTTGYGNGLSIISRTSSYSNIKRPNQFTSISQFISWHVLVATLLWVMLIHEKKLRWYVYQFSICKGMYQFKQNYSGYLYRANCTVYM